MTNYVPENYKDLFRIIQYVAQGDSIADVTKFLAGPPTNPTFALWGRNIRFKDTYNPIGHPLQILTDENRTSFILIKNSARIDFQFELTDFTYNGILDWFLSVHESDFNPRALFYSRKPQSTEYFKQFYGVVPNEITITFPDDNKPIMVSGNLLACKPVAESTTGPTIGSGAYASANTDTPLLPTDGGTDSFDYNSTVYKTKGMSISVQHIYSILDPDESYYVEHMTPVARSISGTVNIFKKQGADALHADIVAKTVRAMRRVIKPFNNPTNGCRIDLSNVLLAESDEQDHLSIKNDSVLKPYNFTAGGLTLSQVTS